MKNKILLKFLIAFLPFTFFLPSVSYSAKLWLNNQTGHTISYTLIRMRWINNTLSKNGYEVGGTYYVHHKNNRNKWVDISFVTDNAGDYSCPGNFGGCHDRIDWFRVEYKHKGSLQKIHIANLPKDKDVHYEWIWVDGETPILKKVGGVANYLPTVVGKSRKIALRADNGQYLARCAGCIRGARYDHALIHASSSSAKSAQWDLIKLSNGKYVLRSDSGLYLSRCSGCVRNPPTSYDPITIHSDSPRSSEAAQWKFTRLANGKYKIKSDNGKYINRCVGCLHGVSRGHGSSAIANGDGIGKSTQWQLVFID